jgi:hypothetical protein
MNVMMASGKGHCTAIRFEFGRPPEEAIAILQDTTRYVDVDWDLVTDHQGMDMIDEFVDKHLGNRAMIWAESEWLLTGMRHEWEAYDRHVKWRKTQEAGIRTLLWTANHSPANILIPETSQLGLIRGLPSHDAVGQILLAQAAFWAMTQSYRST